MVDNWALIYAQQLALEENLPLHVCFCLVPRYLEYTYRQYAFMLKGLQYVAKVRGKSIMYPRLAQKLGCAPSSGTDPREDINTGLDQW